MSDQRLRSLKTLGIIQAAMGGVIAVVIFSIYGISPHILTNTGLSLAAAIMGAIGAVYYLTLHQILSRQRLALSTLILTLITALNLALVITTTGGLDSPYYSLWLLAIVAAGIFGLAETLTVLGLTVAYYAFEIVMQGLHAPYIRDHIVQLVLTITAAGLAEWVHSRGRKATGSSSGAAKPSGTAGQFSTAQLKADTIMSSIGEGVMVIDGTHKIQLFNKAAQELTGWDEASAQNIDYNAVLQLKNTEDQPLSELTDPFNEAWSKQITVVRDNLTTTTRSGRKVQLSLSVSPMYDDAKNPTGAIALFRDISQEKEVERQKEEFVSTASHEMRTPVAAIEGYISLAMNANVATIDDRAMKYLTKAHETISHLGELFRDLLSVTKAEEGQLNAKIEPTNLGKLLQSAVDDMQFTVQKKKLTLVYQIGNQTGKTISPLYYVAVNPERLREVVMNLIDNAVKFTPEGGIKVILEGTEKDVTVSVSDTGLGIAAEDIPHLFQKFYRIDSTDTRTIGGTGLGLYLCRRVIEAFNGRVWIESKLGQGSNFRFTLPRLSQDEVSRMEAAATAAVSSGPGGVVQPGVAPAPAPAATVPPPTPVQPAYTPQAQPVPGQATETGPAITPTPTPNPAPAAQSSAETQRRRIQ
ncbi:MAG: hypothetical protein JWN01_820 [Patescibacteria group bacterium]|nr:hypothetical protein [Patescibacteria group bacterium]